MRFGLDKRTWKKFMAVFKNYPQIEKLVIYGSRTKGNFREGSDIDLTVMGRIQERVTKK